MLAAEVISHYGARPEADVKASPRKCWRDAARWRSQRLQRLLRRRLLRAGVASLGGALFPVLAAARRTQARANAAADIATTDLGGLALLQVAGVNVLALHGDDGALMVDGGPAASADALLRAVYAATGNDRIHTLINTHGHPEQTGANEIVGRAGGVILAHEKTQMFLSHAMYSALFEGRRAVARGRRDRTRPRAATARSSSAAGGSTTVICPRRTRTAICSFTFRS